ncbi:hypothetical protein BHM03_00003516, partial [Ensete ventricosum]
AAVGGEMKLEFTPTWIVAAVCSLMVVISLVVERLLHRLGKHVFPDLFFLFQGKVPLLSLEAIHQLHIFIFVLAVTHVAFSALTMLLGGAKVSFCLFIRYVSGNNGRIQSRKKSREMVWLDFLAQCWLIEVFYLLVFVGVCHHFLVAEYQWLAHIFLDNIYSFDCIFDEHVQEGILDWAQKVKRRKDNGLVRSRQGQDEPSRKIELQKLVQQKESDLEEGRSATTSANVS